MNDSATYLPTSHNLSLSRAFANARRNLDTANVYRRSLAMCASPGGRILADIYRQSVR